LSRGEFFYGIGEQSRKIEGLKNFKEKGRKEGHKGRKINGRGALDGPQLV